MEGDGNKGPQIGRLWKWRQQIRRLGSKWEVPPCLASSRKSHVLSPEEADCDTSPPSHQLPLVGIESARVLENHKCWESS